jgi:hypothetical protein
MRATLWDCGSIDGLGWPDEDELWRIRTTHRSSNLKYSIHCVKRKVSTGVSADGYTRYQRYQTGIGGIEQGSAGTMLLACTACVSDMLQEEPGTDCTRACPCNEILSP